MNLFLKGFLISILLMVSMIVMAQPKISSPFSRFGLGDFAPRSFPALNGMGNISAAYDDGHHVNLSNPASYAFLSETSFEIGFDARRSSWKEGTQTDQNWSGNITHLALGFQLTNRINEVLDGKEKPVKFGMALALTPRTLVGYNISVNDFLDNGTAVLSNYKGSGGTYTLTWGNAVRYKNFGFGVNFNYLFGNIENLSTGEPQVENSYNYSTSNNYSVRGVLWDFGAMYRIPLKDPKQEEEDLESRKMLVLGAHVGTNSKFNTNRDLITTRTSSIGDLDSFSINNQLGEGNYPFELGVGVNYVFKDKLRAGVNFTLANWSAYENPASTGSTMEGSYSFGIGGEYIPDAQAISNYLKRLRYRLGFKYVKDPRVILNNSLTNYGVTFGLGIPVLLAQRQASYVNISLELGQFGLPGDDLKENYIKLALGFTLNDNRWFFKRKFN